MAIISYYSFQNKVTGRLFLVRHEKSLFQGSNLLNFKNRQ